MDIEFHSSTYFNGLRLDKSAEGFQFKEEEYRPGEELNSRFAFSMMKEAAKRLGIEPTLYLCRCSDEVNDEEHQVRSASFGGGFINALIGTQLSQQPTFVALKAGHDSRIIEVNTHLGIYRPENKSMILAGKIRGRDRSYRDGCGALGHVLDDMLHGHEPQHLVLYTQDGKKVDVWRVDPKNSDYNFLGGLYEDLLPFKKEITGIHNDAKGGKAEKFAYAMRHMSLKNLDVQTRKAIEMVKEYNLQQKEGVDRLIFGTLSLNRVKYPDTLVVRSAYLLKADNELVDLTTKTF